LPLFFFYREQQPRCPKDTKSIEGRTILRRIYEEVNKNLKSYYANSVKIIKPGTYLLHNLTDSSCMLSPPAVRVFIKSPSGPPEEIGGNSLLNRMISAYRFFQRREVKAV
jgi:hypothetical protein